MPRNRRQTPDRPYFLFGKITFDFYNNQDEEFKISSLRSLAKGARKDFNVSCLPVEENEFSNPERGSLILACCGSSPESAKELLSKIVSYFDSSASARILSEEIQEGQIE